MLRKLFDNKKRLISCIICLLLSVAFICCGASFLLNKDKKTAFATSSVTDGFKVVQGAAIRYSDETPGIRFKAEVSKAQYEAWASSLSGGQSIAFHFSIKGENMKNQDGSLVQNEGQPDGVVYYSKLIKKDVTDIAKWDFDRKGNYTVSFAIFLNKLWGDETARTAEELYDMYGEMKFSVYEVHAHVCDASLNAVDDCTAPLAVADNSANTTRTMRSVALAIYAQNKDADSQIKTDIQKSYLYDKLGLSLNLFDVSKAYFYDLDENKDSVQLTIEDLVNPITTNAVKVYIGAKEIATENIDITDNVLTISHVRADLVKGEKYVVIVDAENIVYSFSNVTAVTKVITTKDEFKNVFTLKNILSSADTGNAEYKITETFTANDGTVYTQDFYGNSQEIFRGYYVLGADIDFGDKNSNQKISLEHEISGVKGINVENSALNGLYGFGGTFDGNGHTIKNLIFSRGNSNTASGLFGALAYGATIKNVAITNVGALAYAQENYKLWGEPQRPSTIIASNVGDVSKMSDETKAYLNAKYGSLDTILMEDMYVSLTKDTTVIDQNNATDPYYTINGENVSHNLWYYTKKNGGLVYGSGGIGLVYKLDAQTSTMRNVVLDMPNPGLMPSARGRGFFSEDAYDASVVAKTQGAFENCYLISAPSNISVVNGLNMGVGVSGSVILDNGTSSIKANGNWADSGLSGDSGATVSAEGLQYTYEDVKISGTFGEGEVYNSHLTFLASNDYDAIAGSTASGSTQAVSVYQGLDGSGNWEYKIADGESVQGNSYVMRATGVVRYDSLEEMKNDSNLSKLNLQNWDISGTSVAWKNSNNKGLEITFKVGGNTVSSLDIGDVANVTVKYNDKDVTNSVNLFTDDTSVLAINGNTITCSEGVAKLIVRYSVGDKVISKTISIGIDKTVDSELYVSADESKVRGSQNSYSSVYSQQGSTNNYALTTLEGLYKASAGSSAVLNSVYAIDPSSGYVEQTLVTDDNGAKALLVEDNNTLSDAYYILVGNNGAIKVPKVKIVTAVIADEFGFNYIPTDANTRSGYYVLANDFDCLDTSVSSVYDSDVYFANKLNVKTSADATTARSQQIGYSFGARVVTSLTAAEGDTGFNGVFDGLGHTINNMEVSSNGLLGVYTVENALACTLKNVKFTNFRSRNNYASAYADGAYTSTSAANYAETLLCRINYKDTSAVPAGKTINFENVVLEMAKWGFQNTSRYYRNASPYYNNGAEYNNVATCNRFSFISYGNVSAQTFKNARVIFDDVILSYDVGYGAYSDYGDYQGGAIFSFRNSSTVNNPSTNEISLGYDSGNNGSLGAESIKGLYIIQQAHKGESQAASDLGKVVALAAWIPTSSSETNKNIPTIIYTNNDYATLTGDNTGYVSTGWYQGVDANGNYIHSKTKSDITTYLKACNKAGDTNPTAIATCEGEAYRYNTYEEMANAGVTKIGGFTITDNGANWN